MREIVTLQFGERSNYLGTHFWNTQASALFLDCNLHPEPFHLSSVRTWLLQCMPRADSDVGWPRILRLVIVMPSHTIIFKSTQSKSTSNPFY
jgi:hypothetical protein